MTFQFRAATDVEETGKKSLGMNMSGPWRGTLDHVFINRMKVSERHCKGIADKSADVDANGYPIRLAEGEVAWTTNFRRTNGELDRGGRYELRWTGEHDWVTVTGPVTIVSLDPVHNVLIFDLDESGTSGNVAVRVDVPAEYRHPNDLPATYPRDMHITILHYADAAGVIDASGPPEPEYQSYWANWDDPDPTNRTHTYNVQEELTPGFLNIFGSRSSMRFNQWIDGNYGGIFKWSTNEPWVNKRSVYEDRTWKGQGQANVPFEMLIDLCNRFSVSPWFSLPHEAYDSYIRDCATYVRDNLNDDLVPTFCIQNEPWNVGFGTQKVDDDLTYPGAYAQNQQNADALWGGGGSVPRGYLVFASKRATEGSVVIRNVFAETGRAVRTDVNCHQPGHDIGPEYMLLANINSSKPGWRIYEPGNVYKPGFHPDVLAANGGTEQPWGVWHTDPTVNGGADLLPHQVVDQYSITGYFGSGASRRIAGDLLAAFGTGDETGLRAATNLMLSQLQSEIVTRMQNQRRWKRKCQGLAILNVNGDPIQQAMYEGNHHLVAAENETQASPDVVVNGDTSVTLTGIGGDIQFRFDDVLATQVEGDTSLTITGIPNGYAIEWRREGSPTVTVNPDTTLTIENIPLDTPIEWKFGGGGGVWVRVEYQGPTYDVPDSAGKSIIASKHVKLAWNVVPYSAATFPLPNSAGAADSDFAYQMAWVDVPYQGSSYNVPDSIGQTVDTKTIGGTVLYEPGGVQNLISVNGRPFWEVFMNTIYPEDTSWQPVTIGDLHDQMCDTLRDLGVVQPQAFILLQGPPGMHGMWGYYRDYSDSNVMGNAMEAWSAANPQWWL